MNPDVILLLGLVILALTVPIVISAFSTSNTTMRPALLTVAVGGSMIIWAIAQAPGGYSLADVPAIALGVFR